jgi:hypothetical protein
MCVCLCDDDDITYKKIKGIRKKSIQIAFIYVYFEIQTKKVDYYFYFSYYMK